VPKSTSALSPFRFEAAESCGQHVQDEGRDIISQRESQSITHANWLGCFRPAVLAWSVMGLHQEAPRWLARGVHFEAGENGRASVPQRGTWGE